MRTYGPGNGTYGKEKKTGIAFPCRRNPAGGHEACHTKKIEKGVFPLGKETGKNTPTAFLLLPSFYIPRP